MTNFTESTSPTCELAVNYRSIPVKYRYQFSMNFSPHIQQPDDRNRELASLRRRLSRLSEAGRRINESLDLDTVLQEVVDGARALTDSRYGVITTLDPSHRPLDFVTSGLSDAERRDLEDFLPEGLLVYRYLSALKEPLRVDDYQSHVASLGLPDFCSVPIGPFLAVAVRHGGRDVGNFYVAREPDGREFSQEDEEVLIMFAAQAALVIANARQRREERRALAHLETLVDTSPVGVVVFDAITGAPVSFNREARRLVDALKDPGQSPEQLLEAITVRREDGREFSLDQIPLAQLLAHAETVRAEEIVLRVPDGRSVSTLVNATPIQGGDGEVTSFVATLQDLSPLEDLERLRADFLAAVSHELRTPLTSISGAAATLLAQGAALDPAESRQFHPIIAQQAEGMRTLLSDLLDATRLRTGTLPVSPEPSEPAPLLEEARSTFLASGWSGSVTLDPEPDLPWVMADRRRILQVLDNLLSNAARHSPRGSAIRLGAAHEEGLVSVSVSDQGRGLEPELLSRLFHGFSRRDADGMGEPESMESGLGLSISKGIVEAHGGRIRAESDGPGLGSRFIFTLPVVEGVPGASVPRNGPAGFSGEEESILVVDADPLTVRHVRELLAGAGYRALIAGDGEEALRLLAAHRPRLALLDLLPGGDGIGLMARVRNALRRQPALVSAEPVGPFTLGDLRIDYARRRVSLVGETVALTATEYDLLFELSVNAGRALTFDDLLERVWGPRHARDKRSVRAYVKRLRRKLDDDALNPRYIFAENRVGYRMAEPETPEHDGE